MGCIIAVNDYVVQAKRVSQGRKALGCRRKRRGRRCGKKRGRARLVTSRSVSLPHEPAVSTARITYLSKVKERFDSYVMGRAKSITVLDSIRSKLNHDIDRKRKITFAYRQAKERLLQTMLQSGRHDRPFTVIRLRVLLQIVGQGWDSIVRSVYDRPFESYDWEAGVGAIRSPSDWRAVPPPDSHYLVGAKRSRVGKPSSTICRLCGERGHRTTACEAPLARGLWGNLAVPVPKPSRAKGKQVTSGPRKGPVSKKSGRSKGG